MVWNYHDDAVAGDDAPVKLSIEGIGQDKVLVHHYRVDDQYSNSFEAWKAIGKPQIISASAIKQLEASGQLQLITSPSWMKVNDGKLLLKFNLPRHGVSFIQLAG
jgi:xylan 1,4-beta-xylosidase